MAVHPAGTTCAAKPEGCILATNISNTILKSDPAAGEPVILAECTKATMTALLTKNNGTEVEADITTATFEGGSAGGKINGMEECNGTFGPMVPTTNGTDPVGTKIDNEDVENGTPWCLKSNGNMADDEFQIRGGTCSEAAKKITFILDTTLSAGVVTQCKYERGSGEPVKGTYTTHATGEAILSVTAKAGTLPDTTFKGEAGNNVLCPATGTLEMSFTLETDVTPAAPIYIS
jgi:hypothetical protein